VAWIAAALGLSSAAVSAYWALGGTGLLETFGGQIERLGRQGGASVAAGLAVIVLVKAVVALAAPVFAGSGKNFLPGWANGQATRMLGWVAAATLTLYGGYLTVGGLLVKAGVIDIAGGGRSKPFTWHVYFWDPWFLVWGLSLGTCMLLTRAQRGHGYQR